MKKVKKIYLHTNINQFSGYFVVNQATANALLSLLQLMQTYMVSKADRMEITPFLVYGTIVGSSVWILIFCILWLIYSRIEKSFNSPDPFDLIHDPGVQSRATGPQAV